MAVESGEQLSSCIGAIGYEILDDFVGPAIGASDIVADLYLADIMTYFMFTEETTDEDSEMKLCEATTISVLEHYGVEYDKEMVEYYYNMPLALLALYILEHTDYIESNE